MTFFGRYSRRSRRSGGLSAAEKVALAVAAMALSGTLAAPILTAAVGNDPPTTKTCLQLQLDYDEAIRRDPVIREQILPGRDGLSSLADDPQANYCNLTPDKLAQ